MKNFEFHGMASTPAPTPEKGSFGLAESEKSREDIYESSKKLADYISKEEIKNVFFLDNSARQAYIGLREMWKKEHDKEVEPSIYFINPDPVRYGYDTDEALTKEFNERYYKVDKNEKVLIYDVCIHTGSTIFNVQELFKKMGFTDVKIAITSVSDECSAENKEKLDLVCLDDRAKAGCHPYGKPGYIQKTGLMTDKADYNEKKRHQGTVDHQKIKDVFNEK
jgi:galactitol-specific phosphotransferase system IIB component